MKYKQKSIPRIAVPKYWCDLPTAELKKLMKEIYTKRFQGKRVFNEGLEVYIQFSAQGKNKRLNGSAVYPEKVATPLILKQLFEVAEYSNFGNKKAGDPAELLGYLNMKPKCYINGKLTHVKLCAMLYKNMKIDWSHEVNIKK